MPSCESRISPSKYRGGIPCRTKPYKRATQKGLQQRVTLGVRQHSGRREYLFRKNRKSVHEIPESPFTIIRNGYSRSNGITVHSFRNTHSLSHSKKSAKRRLMKSKSSLTLCPMLTNRALSFAPRRPLRKFLPSLPSAFI